MPSDSSTSRCYCSDQSTTFAFQVETEQSSCATTSFACYEDADIRATGEATCSPAYQIADERSCEADLDCTQPASVDGHPIIAEGRLGVLQTRRNR